MDRSSRKDLLQTIEEQKETINKYQGKLKDLIAAYKGLQKEKEALEQTLHALSESTSTHNPENLSHTGIHNDGEKLSDDGSDQRSADTLQKQLVTLSTSLSVLSKEKSKMEMAFQADKKRLRLEFEEKEKLLDEEIEQLKSQNERLQNESQEWRGRVRELQHEREKDQTDHSLMLREIQQLLSAERSQKETLEQQLEDSREVFDYKQKQQLQTDLAKVQLLEEQVARLTLDLATAKHQPAPPVNCEELEQLKEQVQFFKDQHLAAVEREQNLATELKDNLATMSKDCEVHVAELEARVSQLSEAVGESERQRTQEVAVKQKLVQKVAQLEQENAALSLAVASSSSNAEPDSSSQLPDSIMEFLQAKESLLLANKLAPKPVVIAELLEDVGELHLSCQKEIGELKEEFERYKLRAQSALKHKSSKTQEQRSREIDTLQGQVNDLREKMWQLRSDNEQLETQLRERQEAMTTTLDSLKDAHQNEVKRLSEAAKQKEMDLNLDMKKHRERTIALLAEKDAEIESLKSRTGNTLLSALATEQEAGASSEQQAISELLTRSPTLSPGDNALLHFAQEQARKDVELVTLRRQKHSLENELRCCMQAAAERERTLFEQLDMLKEEIRRNERSTSRESANLEYLKNVVYRYMLCADLAGQQSMLNAIATILQFSPKEKEAVMVHLQTSWWNISVLKKGQNG